jgi:hypothetical protein
MNNKILTFYNDLSKIIKKLKMPFTKKSLTYFSERIDIYKYYLEFLENQHIKQCLKILSGNKYSICNNKIILEKQIGSKSKYGTVFLSKINKPNPHHLAIKIIPNDKDSIKELNILKLCTKYVINKDTPHFPIMFNNFECDKKNINNFLPKNINNKSYSIVLNELAGGDLKMFMKNINNIKNNNLLLNTIMQIYISIFTFHKKIKYIHTDCHNGNFLFHRIPPGGYIKYSIFGKIYYLKNMGYLWVIWDFGLTDNKYLGYNNYLDYLKIIHSFMNEKNDGWIVDNLEFNENFSNKILDIYYYIKYNINYKTINQDEKILSLIMKKTGVLLENVPNNSYIYNKEPYFLH